jgi:transcriptional regulator with XRE-family HTH domain
MVVAVMAGALSVSMTGTIVQIIWICKFQIARCSKNLDRGYGRAMQIDEKERLARRGDMGLEALAIRLRAARKVTGLNQKQFAEAVGVKNTVINNAEAGLTAPSQEVMRYLYRAHRIDFNFQLHGDFAQLPGDVQSAIFAHLEDATSEWDRRERSSRARHKPTTGPATT